MGTERHPGRRGPDVRVGVFAPLETSTGSRDQERNKRDAGREVQGQRGIGSRGQSCRTSREDPPRTRTEVVQSPATEGQVVGRTPGGTSGARDSYVLGADPITLNSHYRSFPLHRPFLHGQLPTGRKYRSVGPKEKSLFYTWTVFVFHNNLREI